MFEKLKKIFKNREEKEKHNYDLTFDNVAIPAPKVTRTLIKKMHLSAMTMLPYLRCISETEKINKLNNMYIMQKGLPRAMSKFLT